MKVPQSSPLDGPFEQELNIQHHLDQDYVSPLIEQLRLEGLSATRGRVSLFLAREFGFCYGVERAIKIAYHTVFDHPHQRVFLTAEIIHNPTVNQNLKNLGVKFLSNPDQPQFQLSQLTPEDLVIIPAFGASLEQLRELEATGCALVDTTCKSVKTIWNQVQRYAQQQFTAVIHGRHQHAETQATASRAGGKYIVIRNLKEAEWVAQTILGVHSDEWLLDHLEPAAISPGFNPRQDLQRIGMANQTTMLASESQTIEALLYKTMATRYGDDNLNQHIQTFQTICHATQRRQDAVKALRDHNLDLIIVIGGFNSSNTAHLLELALKIAPAYHIQDPEDLRSTQEIFHQSLAGDTGVSADWLPSGKFRIGVTAGASTPDRVTGMVMDRLFKLGEQDEYA